MKFPLTPKTRFLGLVGFSIYGLIGLAGAQIPFVISPWLILSGVMMVGFSAWITYISWTRPEVFKQHISAYVTNLRKIPVYRWITITNISFLLWFYRFMAPFVTLLGIFFIFLGWNYWNQFHP
jgi:hypothetical protein